MSNKVSLGANNNSAIRWASKNGYSEIVELLLADKRVDPTAQDNYAIRRASARGRVEVVKLLLADKRVDPSGKALEYIKFLSEFSKEILKIVTKIDVKEKEEEDRMNKNEAEIIELNGKRYKLIKE